MRKKYLEDQTTGDFILKKLINEAHLVVYEDSDILEQNVNENFHRYDRIYAYDLKNNLPLVDFLNRSF